MSTDHIERAQVHGDELPTDAESNQIAHMLNRDKKYLSEHGQKLFNAINCLLNDEEQLELTQSLFKYQREHNVFTLVRSCRELFDTSRKKSLMLFMRPVIPIRDRFHYDEYYKLFFPEEFSAGVTSIFSDLIPKDLLAKTLHKANEKKKQTLDKEKEKQQEERLKAIQILEKVNFDLNVDLQKLMSKASLSVISSSGGGGGSGGGSVADGVDSQEDALSREILSKYSQLNSVELAAPPSAAAAATATTAAAESAERQHHPIQIAGFRIIDLAPNENESLGFDICMGPTGTFIMISYVEPSCLVDQMGMRVGDELVSVNDTSFKMINLDEAIEILSTVATLRIVLQTSGFLPEAHSDDAAAAAAAAAMGGGRGPTAVSPYTDAASNFDFVNAWTNPFGAQTVPPAESKNPLARKLTRRICLRPKPGETHVGFKVRGGIEFGLGVFITHVEPRSSADIAGLRVSDQIIEVNGQTFSRISQDDALFILKTSLLSYCANSMPIKLSVRYFGKLPVLVPNKLFSSATPADEQVCDKKCAVRSLSSSSSSSSVDKQRSRPACDTLRPLFRSEKQFARFRHYLAEYAHTRISVQYWVWLLVSIGSTASAWLNYETLAPFVHKADLKIFKRILERHTESTQQIADERSVLSSRTYTDDFKNSLLVRSTEVLCDLNISSVNKSSKFDTFVDDFYNKKSDCDSMRKPVAFAKSMDNLSYNSF